jgi:hypothetical protein
MAYHQQTAPPQQRRSKNATAHPHQIGARPDPPHPDPVHSRHPVAPPNKSQGQVPITEEKEAGREGGGERESCDGNPLID